MRSLPMVLLVALATAPSASADGPYARVLENSGGCAGPDDVWTSFEYDEAGSRYTYDRELDRDCDRRNGLVRAGADHGGGRVAEVDVGTTHRSEEELTERERVTSTGCAGCPLSTTEYSRDDDRTLDEERELDARATTAPTGTVAVAVERCETSTTSATDRNTTTRNAILPDGSYDDARHERTTASSSRSSDCDTGAFYGPTGVAARSCWDDRSVSSTDESHTRGDGIPPNYRTRDEAWGSGTTLRSEGCDTGIRPTTGPGISLARCATTDRDTTSYRATSASSPQGATSSRTDSLTSVEETTCRYGPAAAVAVRDTGTPADGAGAAAEAGYHTRDGRTCTTLDQGAPSCTTSRERALGATASAGHPAAGTETRTARHTFAEPNPLP